MKIQQKYCFRLTLNRIPVSDINIEFEACDSFTIEPTQVLFSKTNFNPKQESFCITPKIINSVCSLNFYLQGQSISQYSKPASIDLYSIAENVVLKKFTHPIIIELTNRLISEPLRFSFEKSEYLNISLQPTFKEDAEFFTFSPKYLHLSHLAVGKIEFFITPNVDCPMTVEMTHFGYYVIEFMTINGSSSFSDFDFAKPTPLYIKVMANDQELNSRQEWCESEFNCNSPPNGMTCIPDECVLREGSDTQQFVAVRNKTQNESTTEESTQIDICLPLIVGSLVAQSEIAIVQIIIIVCLAIILLVVFLYECGCLQKVPIPEMEEEDEHEIKERQIFNTKENMKEAEVAIENLLKQIDSYEKQLDVHARYERNAPQL